MTDTAPPTESGDTQDEPQPQPRQRVRTTLIGLALGLVVPFGGVPTAYALRATGSLESRGVRVFFGVGWDWVVAIVVVLYVLRVERRPLGSIGFRWVRWTYLATTPLWWLLGAVMTAALVIPLRDHIDTTPAEALTTLPLAARIAIVLTAPVTEELFFRGYAVERLTELTGRMWLAAALSTVVFACLHIPYYGLIPGLIRIPVSAVLTIRYIRGRSLVPAIALHFLIDLPLAFAVTSG
jgi:membrane protease YdiL (CAAX protease family)